MHIRQQMKADLLQAMKAREHARVDTLRTVLAAIDNAEAVPVSQSTMLVEPVFGKKNEVPRKILSTEDIQRILQNEVDERHAASIKYAGLGQNVEAERLQKAAELITSYIPASSV